MKFPKLNKETSLYKLGAIRLALLEAASTATDYVTEITGGGIMVHPIDDDLSGWKIADTLELIKQGVTAFSVALASQCYHHGEAA